MGVWGEGRGGTFGVMTSEAVSHKVVGFLLKTVFHSTIQSLSRVLSQQRQCWI